VVFDLDESAAEQVVRVLAPMGLIFDADSPWLRVTACAGKPACASALADVRADATAAVEAGTCSNGLRWHWSGCERRCGRPRGETVDAVARTGGGYRIETVGLPALNDGRVGERPASI
jgi:precorrin-3B synthase